MRVGAEPNVLWPGLVTHFAQTSGTTAGDKFILAIPMLAGKPVVRTGEVVAALVMAAAASQPGDVAT
mgnify:CR=1 FL=1